MTLFDDPTYEHARYVEIYDQSGGHKSGFPGRTQRWGSGAPILSAGIGLVVLLILLAVLAGGLYAFMRTAEPAPIAKPSPVRLKPLHSNSESSKY